MPRLLPNLQPRTWKVFFCSVGAWLAVATMALAADFPSINGTVRAVAHDSSRNIVYIGGDFTQVGGQSRQRLAALNATTGALLPWNPSVNAAVNVITVDGSRIYVGGRFTEASGNTTVRRVAAFDLSGNLITSWLPRVQSAGFPPGLDPQADPSRVNAIHVFGDRVIIGGLFTQAGALARRHLAAFAVSNAALDNWNPGASSEIFALASRGSSLFVGGDFTEISGSARSALASYGSNLSLQNFDPSVTRVGSGGPASVNALVVEGSTLYLGGNFNRVGSTTRNNLAAVNSQGNPTSFNTGSQVSNPVTGVAVADGIVYVTAASGTNGQSLAFDASGSRQTWRNGVPNGAPLAIANLPGEILVAGTFNRLVGATRVDSGGGGGGGGGSGGGTKPPANGRPIVEIVSKENVIRVTGPRFRVRGTAAISEGNKIRRIEVKVGKKKFRRAKGKAKWSFRSRVPEGKTLVRVRAVGTNGKRSNIARIRVVR